MKPGRNTYALFLLLLNAACGAAASESADESSSMPPSEDTMTATIEGSNAAPADTTGSQPSSQETTPAPVPAPAPSSSTTPAPAAPAKVAVPYRGINLNGAEFGGALPGVEDRDYTFPTTTEIDYFLGKGVNTFRIAFAWERLQPSAKGAFTDVYGAKLFALVDYASAKGAHVILNPQNFARYYGKTVGSAEVPSDVFADLWSRLAARFGKDAHVMFNLVNEPHDIATEQWVSAANAAIAAIRTAGAPNTVIAPGNGWTGAHSWAESSYGTPNSVAMLDVVDPANNTLFEVHQYLDTTSAGDDAACVSATIGTERLAPFLKWLRDNGKKGFLGEFAGGDNPTCDAAVKDMLATVMASSDVLEGFTYWSAGPQWKPDYIFSLEPQNGQDRAQMTRLSPYLF